MKSTYALIKAKRNHEQSVHRAKCAQTEIEIYSPLNMRLKTVQVHGFKTFAHPTTFHFGDGITAIVGPNGCGKSNIADAIRWALGEQSPSNLRTKKTEDLIFSGSATRPKMGMAEVALTLENPFSLEQEPQQSAAPSTNGDASNGGTPTANIQLPQAEVGRNSNLQSPPARASVVQEILRARPSEVTILRRAYRSGENEYLINRQRVRLRDVQELLQQWGLARLTYAVIGQGLIDQALSLRAEERRALFEEAAGIGLYQNKKANALEKLEETQQNLIRVNDIINEIAPRLPSLARQADRASKYESVAAALNTHLRQWYAFNWAHAQEGFLAATGEESAAREKLYAQRGLMQDLAARLTETRRTAQALRTKLAEHRRAQQQRELEFAARERELAVLQERARFAETRHSDAQRELENASTLVESALAALQAAAAQPTTLSIEQPTPAAVPIESAESHNTAKDSDKLLAEIQAQHQAELARLAEQQRAAQDAQNAQAEKLSESEQRTEAEWNAAAERFHAEIEQSDAQFRAQAEQQQAALAQEREQNEYERARALVKQRLAHLRLAEFDAPALGTLAVESEIEPETPPDLAAHLISLQATLPLYEYAVQSVAGLAAQADDLARRERDLRERERLLERVRQEASESGTALALAERDVQTARQAQVTAQREWERSERERSKDRERAQRERERERERAREQLQREREKIALEQERVRREHEQLVREGERLLQERTREQERERERQRERVLERQREQERERERALRAQQQERERLTRERDRALREQETKTARLAAFAAQIAEIATARDAAQAQVQDMRAALQSLNEVAFPDETALNESERLQNELEEREAELRSGLTTAEELYNRAVLEAERRRAEIARLEQEIEDDLGPVELDSNAPRQLRLRLVVAQDRPQTEPAQTSGSDAAPQISNSSPDNAPTDRVADDAPAQELITLPDVESLPDGFDKEIRRLKNQMRYIGNVNPNAPQEYAELKERHAFLTAQAADLTSAIEKLRQATAELDEMMKQKFQETFNAINAQFKNYFTMLFGGGAARLELTDEADLIHSGIEITARPPGKRAAQLVLLSGGERSLTAAALIFSILKVSPTPFCVMDEVDAALDEANVGRFREGLKELSHASQFIVITHNRVTMEGARAIYGVSMGEDGVSQLLSLKLEEASANVR